jgi:hypothetical protein
VFADRLKVPALKNQSLGARLLAEPERRLELTTARGDWVIGPLTTDKAEAFRVIEISMKGYPEVVE